METFIATEILKALGDGDVKRGLVLFLIFLFVWFEVRGLKRVVKDLTAEIKKSFADGVNRFEAIEATQRSFEHRLTVIEEK